MYEKKDSNSSSVYEVDSFGSQHRSRTEKQYKDVFPKHSL